MADMKTNKPKTTEDKKPVVSTPVQEVKEETKSSVSMEDLMKMIQQQNEMIELLKKNAQNSQSNIISLEGVDKVTVVHIKDYTTVIPLSSGKKIILYRLKQTQEITRSEALEIANNYPQVFENGWITYGGDLGQQILESNGILIDKKEIDKIFNYKECIDMEKDEVVEFYKSLMDAQKEMFIFWWYEEASKDNEKFLNIEIVNALNSASGGRFKRLLTDKIANNF